MAMTGSLPVPTMAPPLPQVAPPNSSLIDLNDRHNMSTSSLTEALLLLTGMYINLVQPEPGPVKVGLHAFFPNTRGDFIKAVTNPFSNDMEASRTLRNYRNIPGAFEIATSVSNDEYTPKVLLDALCKQVFPQNSITLFYMNNHVGLQQYLPAAVKYLPSLMESLGLPIIAYDTQFSYNTRPALSLQLAPTMGQMMDAFFAFLQRFNWSDFSFLCTLSFGCQEEITVIRQKVEESHRTPNVSVYGVNTYAFELMSFSLRILSRTGHFRGEIKDIMTVAERLGLVGREYVWIYTSSSITLSSRVSKTYPLGSFIIGFDSKRDHMADVVKTGLSIWLQALDSLAASPEIADIDFETGFSCDRYRPGQGDGSAAGAAANSQTSRPSLRWKYGELLYQHMLKVKLPGNFEFDHQGILTSNKFWIKNVQPKKAWSPRTSEKRPSSGLSRFGGSSRGRSQSRGSPFGGRARNPSPFSSNRAQSGIGSSRNRSPSSRRPTSRDRTSSMGYNTRNRSPPVSRGSSKSSSNFDQGSEAVRNSQPNEPLKRQSRAVNRGASLRRRPQMTAADWSLQAGSRLRARRSMRRRMRRALDIRVAETVCDVFFKTSILVEKMMIATWDGQSLSVTGITWPGGSSKPPKGKPEKYTLKVVTWQEDPQVTFTALRETTDPKESPCDANSLPCKIYERDKENVRLSNVTKNACCTGLCIDLLKKLGEMLHFNVELSEVDEGSYGSPLNENRTEWDGMLGKLVHGQADMAMGALSITPQRAEPYDYSSWSLILVFSVHATGASIFIFEWLSPYGLDQGKTPLSVHKFSLFRSFWLIWAMLFGASVSTDQPRGCASRFLANIWALFAVVFCASYTANLAAFMITKDDYYDLSGVQDWRLKNPNHRKPPFRFATIEKSATDLNIAENYQDIYTYMKQNPQTDVKSAIRNLKGQKIQAFIYDSTTLEYEVGKDDGCRLKTVGKRIAETGYGVAFPKKSQWTKQVNKALLLLQEDGEIERLQKFWLAGACHKKKETGVSSHTLGILNFTSAFILLGVGVVVGIVLLLVEHCYFRFGRKSLKKWDKCGCCSLVSLSMGQSLTFEQSVMEAIDFHRQHKCKDPLCETQLWKVKHELDLALLKIGQLRKQLAHTSALEASNEDMSMPEKMEQDSPPYQNGSTRRRRRQRAGDDVTGRTPDDESGTREPLLALEMGSGEPDSDEDPEFNTTRKYTTPTPEDVLYAPMPTRSQKASGVYSGRPKAPRESLDNLQRRPSDRAKPSANTPVPGGAANITGNDQVRHRNTDDHLPPYPSPPAFEEALALDNYQSSRSPVESSLPPPNLTPPPPLRSPPSLGDPPNQGSMDRRMPPVDSSRGTASFPPPPPIQASSDDRHEVLPYSLVRTQPGGSSNTSANTNPKSSSNQPDKSIELPLTNTNSTEDDNDLRLRRQRNDNGNMYINVDKIIGKETYF
ncbi:glutamate receptor ionotropic, nmda 2b-like [Plakobranchus ocellatus]|uniref:Glutamate receptor ionotropic, nmda 2b-like n=1 Tax=Plakobranchus ocellatus TaxID=259542 RepID=A0AAV4D293_9GAST|nr:glutamate receptor ionotropic, nmda 2b-like [Plakobranchus ocellatus]